MPSQCLCRQRQKEIGLRREGDVITEAENAVMQPEAKESPSHQELEEVRNKATPEPPDQTPPTCCCSVTQLYPTLCNPMDHSMPGSPVLQHIPEFAQIHVHWMNDLLSHNLILCHPILLLPSIFPSVRVFSNESALHVRWPKDWSFSISVSNEYLGLITFRIDWFDLLAVQGTLKSPLQHHS